MFRGEFATRIRKYETNAETGKQEAVEEVVEAWETTDIVTTASEKVMAGILRAKADELDPPAGALDHRSERPGETAELQPERPEFSAQQISNAFSNGMREAVAMMRYLLDGWIKDARSNHEGMHHRGESAPCWQTFHVDDIRNMIKDVERGLGRSKD
jgi:hypothetical protein